MNKKILLELGLILPLFTVIVFSAIYFYEYGYLAYFGIPKDFIEVEIVSHSYVLFIFLVSALLLSLITQPMISGILMLFTIKSWIFRIVLIILIGLLLYFVYWEAFFSIYNAEVYYLYIGLILGIALLFLKRTEKKEEILLDSWSAIKYINHYFGFVLGEIITVSTLICIIMLNIGLTNAKNSKIAIFKMPSQDQLIRRYSSYALLGFPDSTTHHVQTLIVERAPGSADTFFIKTKN